MAWFDMASLQIIQKLRCVLSEFWSLLLELVREGRWVGRRWCGAPAPHAPRGRRLVEDFDSNLYFVTHIGTLSELEEIGMGAGGYAVGHAMPIGTSLESES